MNLIPDFNFINGEYILKELYNLNNINEVFYWAKQNLHLNYKTIIMIINYGLIYYIDEAKYIQDEIVYFLNTNKNKLLISLSKEEIGKELEKFINQYKNNNLIDKENIKFL
jgi:hypothetical protein